MKIVLIWAIAVGSVLATTTAVHSQTLSKNRINAKLPTVFIEFVLIEKPKDVADNKNVWLRLRNNSKWIIKVDASGGETEDTVGLYYETLDAKDNVKDRHLCHVCSVIGIKPGKSLLFSVPYDEITAVDSLRIQFQYEWEDRIEVAPAEEPTHYVVFYPKYSISDGSAKNDD